MARTPRLHVLPAAFLFCLSMAPNGGAQVSYFSAFLTGDQEVPAVTTSATGWAIVALNEGTRNISVFVESQGLSAGAAHLHRGDKGANGPIVLSLTGGPTRWTGSGTLSTDDVARLKNEGTYVNLHTAANSAGEIRGQVITPRVTRFVAALDGSQENPPVNTNAKGTGVAYLHEPDNVVVYSITSTGFTTNVTAAHFHRGERGSNGPVVVALNGTGGNYCGVTPRLSDGDVRELKSKGLYFNIHTTANSSGEIRGQILPGDTFSAVLDGKNEVPPVATNARGHGCVELNPDGTLSYDVNSSGFTSTVTAAHFHRGAPGVAGPVIFGLSGSNGVYKGSTSVLNDTQLAGIRAGLYYFNVHTSNNQSGEIRGQILPVELPSTFGGSCPGSQGRKAEIGADGFPCPGHSFATTLYGARPSTIAILAFGTGRSSLGSISLPFDLAPIGAGGCFLFIDLGAAPVFVNTMTDTTGCSGLPIPVPASLALVGAQLFAQWAIVDQGANTANFVTSNALSIRVQ